MLVEALRNDRERRGGRAERGERTIEMLDGEVAFIGVKEERFHWGRMLPW